MKPTGLEEMQKIIAGLKEKNCLKKITETIPAKIKEEMKVVDSSKLNQPKKDIVNVRKLTAEEQIAARIERHKKHDAIIHDNSAYPEAVAASEKLGINLAGIQLEFEKDLERFLTKGKSLDPYFVRGHGQAATFSAQLRDPETYGPLRSKYRAWTKLIDNDFNLLEPTKETVTLYRGITGAPFIEKDRALYKSFLEAKPGDILTDKGYGYYAPEYNYTKSWGHISEHEKYGLPKSLTIQTEFPPGAKISGHGSGCEERLIPRNAKTEVIGSEYIGEDKKDFLLKVRYLLPE